MQCNVVIICQVYINNNNNNNNNNTVKVSSKTVSKTISTNFVCENIVKNYSEAKALGFTCNILPSR